MGKLRNRGNAAASSSSSTNTKTTNAGGSTPQKKIDQVEYTGNTFRRFCCYMFEPDDASYLAVFRVLWGLIMMLEIWGHIKNDYAKTISSFYERPGFAYKFYGLEWCVAPEDENLLKIFMIVMFILGTFITIGFLYRLSSIIYTIGFIYMFGLEAGLYLNHFYLVIIMCVMMCFLPCNVYFSVDALLFPSIASSTVPKYVFDLHFKFPY